MRLSTNLHIACTGSCVLVRRAGCLREGANISCAQFVREELHRGRLFTFHRLELTADDQTAEFPLGFGTRGLSFFLFRPRIYISPREHEITRKLYGVSNIRSFSSGSAAIALRTSFAKVPVGTYQTRVRRPSPVVIYLRFVCPPAGEELALERIYRGKRNRSKEVAEK